jgi:hypothetical protein
MSMGKKKTEQSGSQQPVAVAEDASSSKPRRKPPRKQPDKLRARG